MFLFALKRTRVTRKDLLSWFFLLLAPLLYILNFKGELDTPSGRLFVVDRGILRSFAYGFFKTHFAYFHGLRVLRLNGLFLPVIVDVGANVGDFTLATRNIAGKILAIEPAEENFLALTKNLSANCVDNVLPLRLAAHDQEEDVFLKGESSNMFVARERSGQLVRGMPLDAIIKRYGIRDVDLMKIDVQGHEMRVLLGMRDLLQKRIVKRLIIEVHLRRGVSTEDIISFMKNHGYHLIHKDDYLFDQPHLYFALTRFGNDEGLELN